MGVSGTGAPGMKAALGELLAQLRGAAVGGVVPARVFAQSVRALGLGHAERDRLRDELARLGLPVQDLAVHVEPDSPDVEKVARICGENVFPRLDQVRRLLARYADADGYVTSRAVDGVIRLAGLNTREAAELRAEARVRGVDAMPDESAPAESTPARDAVDSKPSEEPPDRGDFADAVAAALSVLRVDRVQQRPENRILSAEAEAGLAVLVRGGADRAAREPEEVELTALPPGDLRIRARDCLVLHNQRLVHSLVRPYLEQGLDYDDLFQHGVLGLMRAARKFDPTMGNKFSTYATWWVRQSVARAIADEGALIRIPVHMHEQMRKVAAAERKLSAQGKPTSAAGVAVLCDLSLAKVEEARRLSRRTDSLDRVVGDGATLGDFVGWARPLPSVEETVLNRLMAQQAMAVVGTFTGRDHRILLRRLGLDGDEPSTLDELGREFGVTRERIRQLEGKLRPALKERLRMAGLYGVPVPEEGSRPDKGAAAVPPRRVATPVAPAPRRTEAGAVEVGEQSAAAQLSPDWERARRLAQAPSDEVAWLAEYALAALGHMQLAVLLGQAGADAAVHLARGQEPDDRHVVKALDVLRRVFDALVAAGLRPEDFFERPAEALVGVTPRAYLAEKPLVQGESRLALRDALREFEADGFQAPQDDGEQPGEPDGDGVVSIVAVAAPEDSAEEGESADSAVDEVAAEEATAINTASEGSAPEDTEQAESPGDRLREIRDAYEMREARLREEYEQRLAEAQRASDAQVQAERQAAEARLADARAQAERELDALEDALLKRADKSLARRERHVRSDAEERMERLKEEHREAYDAAVQKAQRAEETAQYADFHRERADEADQRLRQYREDAEERIAGLEERLRQAEAAVAEREAFLQAARRHAEAVEQSAAQRIAQSEHNAWVRIAELQEQLAAAQGADADRTTFRDRWRR